MDFKTFATHADEIEPVTEDSAIHTRLISLFEEAAESSSSTPDTWDENPEEDPLSIVARFIQGRIFPAWTETKLDVGPNACYGAISEAASEIERRDEIEERVSEKGGIGVVANDLTYGSQTGLGAFGAGNTGGSLTIERIYETFVEISEIEGSGSESRRRKQLFALFKDATPVEAKYLARIILSEMRIGVGEGGVRDAITTAFNVSKPNVEYALQVSNDYGRVAVASMAGGDNALKTFELQVGRPVQAMLAQDYDNHDWGAVLAEPKYDGARVQLHYDGDSARAFSRNMEEITHAIPEVIEHAETELEEPAILDGEVIAVADDGGPGDYQDVMRRFRREDNVEAMKNKIPVRYHAFDCLFAGGDELLNDPIEERHSRLKSVFPEEHVAEQHRFGSVGEARELEQAVLGDGHEGLMFKKPGSKYTPGKRGKEWLKKKPETETLDLAVIGGEWAEGKRADVKDDDRVIGSYLLGARTDDGFVPVGKIGTGVTDEEVRELDDLLKPHVTSSSGDSMTIKPEVVFEIGHEGIQDSTTYESGFALRFPRFVGVREDKPADDADTLTRVERMADS